MSFPTISIVTPSSNQGQSLEEAPASVPRTTIKAFGQSIGMWTLSNKWQWEHHSIMIEPDERRPAVSMIEFVFSQNLKPEHDDRVLAVLFESLTLQ